MPVSQGHLIAIPERSHSLPVPEVSVVTEPSPKVDCTHAQEEDSVAWPQPTGLGGCGRVAHVDATCRVILASQSMEAALSNAARRVHREDVQVGLLAMQGLLDHMVPGSLARTWPVPLDAAELQDAQLLEPTRLGVGVAWQICK